MPNEKNLKRLNALLDAFDSGAVQPDEMMQAIEAVVAIINQSEALLQKQIGEAKQISSAEKEELTRQMNRAHSSIESKIDKLRSDVVIEADDIRRIVAEEVKRVEDSMPEMPEGYDDEELREHIAEHKAILSSLSDLILGENIRNSLEALPEGEKLAIEAIEGLRDELDKRIERQPAVTALIAHRLDQIGDVSIAGVTNGQVLTYNATTGLWTAQTPSGGGITDGNKGDITVSGSGATWTINDASVQMNDLDASGTPSASTFLRGDGSWATPAGSGDVVGPASAVDDRIATFDGTTGKLIQDGGATIAGVRDRSTHTGSQNISTITNLQTTLDAKQDEAVVVSSNQTAVNDAYYVNVANATYTDPSPTEGKGFIVFVRNGTATVGATGYSTAGTIIHRIFHSGAWANYVYQVASSSGITRSITVTSGNTTAGSAASTDYVLLVAGAHTVSLPAASGNTNLYTIKNNHSANITIDTVGAETIDGTASISVAPEESVQIISDGTNYFIV